MQNIEKYLIDCANSALSELHTSPYDVDSNLFANAKTSSGDILKIREVILGGGEHRQAELFLIAGAIGSGKSTFARKLMQDPYFSKLEFVSADNYAENYFSETDDIKKNHRMAKEYMGYKIFNLLSSQSSFVWEMVPSKIEKLFPIRAAAHRNFKLILYYFLRTMLK